MIAIGPISEDLSKDNVSQHKEIEDEIRARLAAVREVDVL